jgi:hypothetical protein
MSETFRITEPSTFWAGDKAYAWAELTVSDLPEPHNFKTRQARIPFENGWMVSIVWGSCSYSSNYDHGTGRVEFVEEPSIVEMAIINPEPLRNPTEKTVDGFGTIKDHDFLLGGDVFPYRTPEQARALLDAVASWPSDRAGELPEVVHAG